MDTCSNRSASLQNQVSPKHRSNNDHVSSFLLILLKFFPYYLDLFDLSSTQYYSETPLDSTMLGRVDFNMGCGQ